DQGAGGADARAGAESGVASRRLLGRHLIGTDVVGGRQIERQALADQIAARQPGGGDRGDVADIGRASQIDLENCLTTALVLFSSHRLLENGEWTSHPVRDDMTVRSRAQQRA
ncbi:MAG TPA: hypothetical protein PL081_05530, partial [Pseudomonadales bacterium]|nr:hypothetical protein [Pseudomonadales bacterium]HNI66326.1 hypothetical protein [Pseudomonadales bacterium]HNJ74502.1 hypothetical protein [Pseudomonadales bacterium]HNL24995.1 hypothetical protein [Pseudomonadales bacterium]HNN66628.1 hypothetical protein [Pseudomonadales bacterium]